MRKRLITAIIVVLMLLAVAVGVIIFMEKDPAGDPEQPSTPETSAVETTAAEETEPVETTEETVGISLPTENPDEVTPEVTFGEEDIVPPVTGDTATGETEGPDANETPEDEF